MNLTHVHLFLNHVPFLGLVFTSIFLAYALVKNNSDLLKLILWAIVVLGLLSVVVLITGDVAEDEIENLPGISSEMIETHETYGWISMILIDAAGIFALFCLYMISKSKSIARWIKYSLVIISVITIISFAIAAKLGGEIRHPEILGSSQEIS